MYTNLSQGQDPEQSQGQDPEQSQGPSRKRSYGCVQTPTPAPQDSLSHEAESCIQQLRKMIQELSRENALLSERVQMSTEDKDEMLDYLQTCTKKRLMQINQFGGTGKRAQVLFDGLQTIDSIDDLTDICQVGPKRKKVIIDWVKAQLDIE
jgi:small-conductance mechanosensitive channel